MIAQAVFDHTPNHQLIAFHHMPRWEPWVFSHQHDLAISIVQTLAHALGVERCNDEIPMMCCFASVDDHQVAVENTGALHAVTRNFRQVDVRRSYLKKLIQRYQLFKVVGRRRRKTGRDLAGINR